MAIFNAEAYAVISAAERAYLEANGWGEAFPDKWEHDGFDRYGISQGHAVNVQKQFDRIFLAAKRVPA